ncbi:MAG: MBL fold metallo-hydrolase [Deltaproteobacteria bacterium]|nr:MBL fold metallo-hydrolase [Deltaproteobacteria bacterium]HCH62166.1 MBL fold metallo-hydrolase [Deltaproteobacteria bacterium]
MARYGGNSSCIEVRAEGAAPLVLDCGTGARNLGRELVLERVSQAHVLFTHFHTDHVFGFPFFGPLYTPNCSVEVAVPSYSPVDAQEKLGRYLNGINHPVRIRDFIAKVSFRSVRPGRVFEIGPYRVHGVSLNHPGGACGYRIEADGRVVCYITDTAPLSRPGEGISDGKTPPAPERRLLKILEEADLVIFDTMFDFDEYLEKMTWGHSHPDYAIDLCEAAGAKRLDLFHHAPDATDEMLDARRDRWTTCDRVVVGMAMEGQCIDLGKGPRGAVLR